LRATSLSIQALRVVTAAGGGGADAMEAAVTAARIEAALAALPPPLALADVEGAWRTAWEERAKAAEARAFVHEAAGDGLSAGSAFRHACTYYQAAGYFAEDLTSPAALATYQRSVDAMARALEQDVPLANVLGRCKQVQIPYAEAPPVPTLTDVFLHAYWCPSDKPDNSNTVIAGSRNDLSAEVILANMGASAIARGFNVVVFDGPGQGFTARNFGLPFRPDWEVVMSAVVDFVLELPELVPSTRLVAWGHGFGGLLAARAFARETRISALMLDEPIYDTYREGLCRTTAGKPSLLADYLADTVASTASFNGNLSAAMTAIDLSFSAEMAAASLSLGVDRARPSDLYDQLLAYTLQDELGGVGSRPVFIGQPALALNGQSELLFAALPTPRSNYTVLHIGEVGLFGCVLRWLMCSILYFNRVTKKLCNLRPCG